MIKLRAGTLLVTRYGSDFYLDLVRNVYSKTKVEMQQLYPNPTTTEDAKFFFVSIEQINNTEANILDQNVSTKTFDLKNCPELLI